MSVEVPNLLGIGYLAPQYTCNRGNVSVPVRWSGIPQGTAELALFVVSFQPAHGKLIFDWAVAGLGPMLHSIPAGQLPARAVVGRNSFGEDGYSICPSKGTTESYAVRVVALPRNLPERQGFDALALYRQAERSSAATSFAGVKYKRP